MCILQRLAFAAVGAVALVGAIHGPRAMAAKVYTGVLVLFAMAGAGTSMRHSFLQRFPNPSSSCGAELEFLIENFPLSQALPKIFAGTGECSKVQWRFLALSIPEWALVWFVILAAAAVWIAFFRKVK